MFVYRISPKNFYCPFEISFEAKTLYYFKLKFKNRKMSWILEILNKILKFKKIWNADSFFILKISSVFICQKLFKIFPVRKF